MAVFQPALSATTQHHPLTINLSSPQELGKLPAAQNQNLVRRGTIPAIAVGLKLDTDGSWTGSTQLPDKRTATIRLTPVGAP